MKIFFLILKIIPEVAICDRLSCYVIGLFHPVCSPLAGWRKNPPKWTCYDRFTEKLQNFNNRVYEQVSELYKRLSTNAAIALWRGFLKNIEERINFVLDFLKNKDTKNLKTSSAQSETWFSLIRFGGITPLFYNFFHYRADIQYLYYSSSTFLLSSRLPLGWGLLWGAGPIFELVPALQQAEALLSEPRRTLLSHAAP